MTKEQIYELVEALLLTTRALKHSKLPGAEYRVQQSEALLRRIGVDPFAEPPPEEFGPPGGISDNDIPKL